MKNCLAFVGDAQSPHAWRPCRGKASADSVFCRRHERMLEGVVLGICVYEFPDGVMDRAGHKWLLADMPVASRVPS
jgi:hypothetical protein